MAKILCASNFRLRLRPTLYPFELFYKLKSPEIDSREKFVFKIRIETLQSKKRKET